MTPVLASNNISVISSNEIGTNQIDYILVGEYDQSFSELDSLYNTVTKNVQIISISKSREIRDFILSNGKVQIHPYWLDNPLGGTIFKRIFDDEFSIHMDETFGQNLKNYKTQKISNHLRSGLYSDIITTEAFMNDYEAVGVRGFIHNIIYYYSYLKKFGSGVFPIEMQHGYSSAGFAVQFQATVNNFSSEYIFDCFGIGASREPVQYLLGFAHQICPFMDILYIENASKLVITGLWPKNSEIPNIEFNSLSINRVRSIGQILGELNKEIEMAQSVELAATRDNVGNEESAAKEHELHGELLETIIDTSDQSVLNGEIELVNSLVNHTLKNLQQEGIDKPVTQLTTDEVDQLLANHPNKEVVANLSDQDKKQLIERMANPHLASAIDQAIGRYEDLMKMDEETQNEFADIVEDIIMESVDGLEDKDNFLVEDNGEYDYAEGDPRKKKEHQEDYIEIEGGKSKKDKDQTVNGMDDEEDIYGRKVKDGSMYSDDDTHLGETQMNLNEDTHRVEGQIDLDDENHLAKGKIDLDHDTHRVEGQIDLDADTHIVNGEGEDLDSDLHNVKGKIDEDNTLNMAQGDGEDLSQDINRIKGRIDEDNTLNIAQGDGEEISDDINRIKGQIDEDGTRSIVGGIYEDMTDDINRIRGRLDEIDLSVLPISDDDDEFDAEFERIKSMMSSMDDDTPPEMEQIEDITSFLSKAKERIGDDEGFDIIHGQLEDLTSEFTTVKGKMLDSAEENMQVSSAQTADGAMGFTSIDTIGGDKSSGMNTKGKVGKKQIAEQVQKTIFSEINDSKGKGNFDFHGLKSKLKNQLQNSLGENVTDEAINNIVDKSVDKAKKTLLKKSLENPTKTAEKTTVASQQGNDPSAAAGTSVKETQLLKKTAIAENENKDLKKQITALKIKVKASESAQKKAEQVHRAAQEKANQQTAESSKKNKDPKKKKETDRSALAQKIQDSKDLDSTNKQEVLRVLEKERELDAKADELELAAKKAERNIIELENGYKKELNKQEKLLKGKEYIIEKAKENIQVAVGRKQKEISNLHGTIERLAKQAQDGPATDNSGEVRQLENDKSALKQQLQSFRKKISILSEKINEFNESDDDDKLRRMSDAVRKSTLKQKSMEKDLSQAMAQNKSLEIKLDQATDAAPQGKQEATNKETELAQTLRKVASEKNIISTKLKNSESEAKKLSDVVKDLNQKIKNIAKETGNKEQVKDSDKVEQIIGSSQQTQDDASQSQQDQPGQAQESSNKKDSDATEQVETQNNDDAMALLKMRKQNLTMQKQLSAFQDKVKILSQKLTDERKSANDSANAQGADKEEDSRLQSIKLKKELGQSQKEIGELKAKLNAAQSLDSSDDMAGDISDMKIADLEDNLRISSSNHAKAANELNKANTEIKGLNNLVTTLQANIEKIGKNTGAPNVAKLEELGNSLRMADMEKKSLSKNLERANDQAEKMQDKVKQLNKKIADLNAPQEDGELQQIKRDFMTQKSKFIETKNKLKSSEKQTESYKAKIKEFDDKMKAMKAAKQEATKAGTTAQLDPKIKHKLETLEKGKKKMLSSLTEAQTIAAESKKSAAKMKAQNNAYKNQLTAMERELKATKTKVEVMSKKKAA